jgi:hypothetical protein
VAATVVIPLHWFPENAAGDGGNVLIAQIF